MRIPALKRIKQWQLFFSGITLGTITGWLLFLIIFGIMHERHLDIITEQQTEIKELQDQIEIFQKDIEGINEQTEKQLLIKKIEVHLVNKEEMKLNEMEAFELENKAIQYLNKLLLHKQIETVSKNKELLISTLENKQFKIEKQRYQLQVKQLYLYTTVEFFVHVKQIL